MPFWFGRHAEETKPGLTADILFLEFHLRSCEPAVEGTKPHTSRRIFKSRTESTGGVGGSPSVVRQPLVGESSQGGIRLTRPRRGVGRRGQEAVAQVFPGHEEKAALDASPGFADCPSCPCGVPAIQHQRVPSPQRGGGEVKETTVGPPWFPSQHPYCEALGAGHPRPRALGQVAADLAEGASLQATGQRT